MDLGRAFLYLSDLPARAVRRLRGHRVDYRGFLFDDLARALGPRKPSRILEIGPRDGEDTRRLTTLGAARIILVDLPNQKPKIDGWLPALAGVPIEVVYGNIMYDRAFDRIEPFDVVWCTGVLYHNPEQLRFIRQLFDLTAPGGHLVLETATARRPRTRDQNCVEIWFPPDKEQALSHHLSTNITHLPSDRAVESWLRMIGFAEIARSDCHRRVARTLAATRVAYLARRPPGDVGIYYGHAGHEFPLGRAR